MRGVVSIIVLRSSTVITTSSVVVVVVVVDVVATSWPLKTDWPVLDERSDLKLQAQIVYP